MGVFGWLNGLRCGLAEVGGRGEVGVSGRISTCVKMVKKTVRTGGSYPYARGGLILHEYTGLGPDFCVFCRFFGDLI